MPDAPETPQKSELIPPNKAPDAKTSPPESEADSNAAGPQVGTRSADSMLSGAKKGSKDKKPIPKGAMVVIAVIAIVAAVFIFSGGHKIKHRIVRHPLSASGHAQSKPNPAQNADGLPTDNNNPSNGVSIVGGNKITAENVQSLAQNGGSQNPTSGGAEAGSGSSLSASSGARHKLGGVPPFNPGATPSEGGGWTPPPYSGGAYQAASGADLSDMRHEREKALKGKSLVFVAKQNRPASAVSTEASAPAPIANLGYATGTYLSTHLEYVASTAVNAPVVADVDYDYERGGRVIIPAGSRLIGTMGASSDTGIVNIRFLRLRLPNGQTYPVSAVGLDHDLMPLKGIVTGRHRFEQLLLAMGGGVASMSSIFAGSDLGSGFSESDMLRMEAANQAGSFTTQQLGQMQNKVSRSLVVTLPAGTPIQAVFIAPSRKSGQTKP